MFSRLLCRVHHLTLNHLHNKQDRDRRGGLLILAYLFTQILTIGGHLRKSIKPMKRGTHATGNRFSSNLSDLEFPCTLHRCVDIHVQKFHCESSGVGKCYMKHFVVCNFACNCSVFITH